MADENILARLSELLKINKCPLEQIDIDTRIEDLQLDSLHLTSLLMDLEEYFTIVVTDESSVKWRRLDDIARYISDYKRDYSDLNLAEIKELEQ